MNSIEELKKKIYDELQEYIIGIDEIKEKEPIYENFNFKNPVINDFLEKINLKLYKHQKEALEKLYNNKNVVVTTPTASGKSLIFRLYIIDKLLSYPNKTFLLIYPLRALLYDQHEKFDQLINDIKKIENTELNIKIRFILGDLTYKEKEKIIKDRPNIIFTTVDNLHLYLLKNHDKLFYFFKNLDLIVVDELHSYRGIFGTNSAYVFRRLIRLLKFFYKNNTFKILSLSATLKDPVKFAKDLFGLDFELIEKDYSKRYKRYIITVDPKILSPRYLLRRTIRVLLENNIKSLIFLESKKGVELSKIDISDLDKNNKVFTYKASYLRDVRKEIEKKFKNNEYIILITTSALELGIDIGDLDCVVNYGIPRDGISSLIQRFGRTGRIAEGLNIMIFKKDALDFYYSTNIKEFFNKIKNNKLDAIPINLYNEKVVRKHLLYLINEFGKIEENILEEYEKSILNKLLEEKQIKKIKDPLFGKEYYTISEPITYGGLRNISNKIYYIVDLTNEEIDILKRIKTKDSIIKFINILKANNKILEEMDEYAFYEYLLPGMVYYTAGKPIRIIDYYSFDQFTFVFYRPEISNIETSPIYLEDVKILNIEKNRKIGDWEIFLGTIKVKKEFIGYIEKYKYENSYIQNINYYKDPIIYEFNTKAIWIVIPDYYKKIVEELYIENFKNKINEHLSKNKYSISFGELMNFSLTINKDYFYEKYRGLASKKIKEIIEEYLYKTYNIKDKKIIFLVKKLVDYQSAFRSGLHAIEHNIIKISPIITNVDSKELGGYSYPIHNQTGKPTIFIYEGYESGVGLSEILYDNIEKLIKKSKKALYKCKCLDGCPRCIYSPKCGNYNEYLDKYSARYTYKIFFDKNMEIFKNK